VLLAPPLLVACAGAIAMMMSGRGVESGDRLLTYDWYEWNRDGEVYGVAAVLPWNREPLLTFQKSTTVS
jgi:hypothetical protein